MHCRWTWPLHTCLCWEEIFRQLDKREFTAPQWHRRYLTVSCATARSPLSDAMCCHIDVGKLLPGEVNSHMAESTPPERAQRSSPPQRLTVTCRGSPHRKHCLRQSRDTVGEPPVGNLLTLFRPSKPQTPRYESAHAVPQSTTQSPAPDSVQSLSGDVAGGPWRDQCSGRGADHCGGWPG